MLSTKSWVRLFLPFVVLLASAARAAEWEPLFNGRDLIGWEHLGAGSMTVENGLIRTHGGMGLLWWTRSRIGKATLRVVYRTERKVGNSGVYIRIPIPPREPWMPVHYGYEVQIEHEPERFQEGDYHAAGTLYSLTKALARPSRPSPEWNVMEITIDGPRTIVQLNGVKVTDYTEGDPVPARQHDYEPLRGARPDDGYIGIQNEGEESVLFKEISVKRLP